MPTFERALDLFLNMRQSERVRLFASSTSAVELPSLTLVEGDAFTLRLHPRQRGATQTSPTEAVDLPVGTSIVAALKDKDALDGDLLAKAEGFTEASLGDDTWQQATFNLNTTELLAAVDGRSRLECRLDIEIQNTDNSERVTFQIPVIVIAEAFGADDADPTAADPGYPAKENLVLGYPADGNYRFKGGTDFQIRETAPTPGYRTVWLEGGQLQFGPLDES